MNTVRQAAQGRWQGILRQLGIPEQFLVNRHGPCPVCEGKDRFRFDDREGRGTYYCNACGAGDGFSLLMNYHGWDFKTAAHKVEETVGTVPPAPAKPKPDPRLLLKRIAREAIKLTGNDPVSRYLTHRGLSQVPQELFYHPGMAYFDNGRKVGDFPAMLALVEDSDGNRLTYHVTYLTPDGHKATVANPKKVMPPVSTISGAAVRLFGCGPHIAVTEGIETAIAVHEATQLPVWAAISANGVEKLQIPEWAERVTIYADNDKSFTGQQAAYALARRLAVSQGLRADVIVPDYPGQDFLDVWTVSMNTRRGINQPWPDEMEAS